MSQGPAPSALEAAVRRGLGLGPEVPVELQELGELSNINYVYRAAAAGTSLYLKVVPATPKKLATPLPRERLLSEAAGLRRFRDLCGADVTVPKVLFVDREEMALGLEDVGTGREVLYPLLPRGLDRLAPHAGALGRALGTFHAATRGCGSLRPPAEEAIVRRVIFDGLMAPGARAVFPDHWPAVGAAMQAADECLVHADLWSKNLLVPTGNPLFPAQPLALVDFEGIFYGDPAFDLGTLVAVAWLPALELPELRALARDFVVQLFAAWALAAADPAWARAVEARVPLATATFLAARSHGPFAYVLSDAAREGTATLARGLATAPPANLEDFLSRLTGSTAGGVA